MRKDRNAEDIILVKEILHLRNSNIEMANTIAYKLICVKYGRYLEMGMRSVLGRYSKFFETDDLLTDLYERLYYGDSKREKIGNTRDDGSIIQPWWKLEEYNGSSLVSTFIYGYAINIARELRRVKNKEEKEKSRISDPESITSAPYGLYIEDDLQINKKYEIFFRNLKFLIHVRNYNNKMYIDIDFLIFTLGYIYGYNYQDIAEHISNKYNHNMELGNISRRMSDLNKFICKWTVKTLERNHKLSLLVPKDNQLIIKRHFLHGEQTNRIAGDVGISNEKVKAIIEKVKKNIFSFLLHNELETINR